LLGEIEVFSTSSKQLFEPGNLKETLRYSEELRSGGDKASSSSDSELED
jgi:hypothetical protein